MEFWGKEVKPGTTVSCEAGEGYVIHLSQAALGESKKVENVTLSVKVDDQKLVIGTLSVEKHPQIMCDLIFDKDFELSHSSKTTSVFFCGYKSEVPDAFEFDSGDDEDEMEIDEIPMMNNKIENSAAKVLPGKDGKKVKQDGDEELSTSDEDSSEDSDTEMSEDYSSDADDLSDDSGSETDDSDEEQTPTPKKAEGVGKKRTSETLTPKKAKLEPLGDKKGAHVSTPHPAKQASKTHADKTVDKKSKDKSPKSGGHSCKSCNKTFGTESALGSHQKAKHGA